ncbi:hypothetical protein, partial [Enterococcus faecium]|uniref:hypothetical protein n=1 Tax=Enterococcus faecium TaxID=1352 RepID=UPI0030C8334A
MISHEVRGDTSHLLEAGQREEGRRPAVGLRADDEEPLLRLRELSRSRGTHGSAGVDVRVDLGRDASDRLERGIEID